MEQALLQLNRYWKKLSTREQRLFAGTILVVCIFILNYLYQSTTGYIQRLENELDRLQQNLINYTHQVAIKQSVEAEYQQVARQHSSHWTEAEIHDRLRQELYRLAQKYPPELNEEGVPTKTLTTAGALVEIPSLQQGILRNTDRNYREYSINLKIPPTEFTNMIMFLQRLQSSPQSLRIDNLDLRRFPMEEKVSADIDITRIITAGMQFNTVQSTNVIPISKDPVDWLIVGGNLVRKEDSNRNAIYLEAESAENTMELSFVRAFKPGERWIVELELASTAEGFITFSSPDNVVFDGKEPINADGKIYHYKFSLTIPKSNTNRLRIRVPHLFIQGNGKKILFYNGYLTKVG